MMIRAGDFKVEVWRGGYPVVCVFSLEGEEIFRIDHRTLSDLEYVVGQTVKVARAYLPDQEKDEV